MLKSYFHKEKVEVGCDEVGRGCLAGPVIAGAVIFPKNYKHPTLNDSKKLTEKQRREVREDILKEAIAWGLGEASSEEIDKINILNASFLAMHRALDKLKIVPNFLLIDGNRFNGYHKIPYNCIIKGDSKFLSIAAASVLAKTYRDDLMRKLALEFPVYGWETNVGYPTKAHRRGIKGYGITPYHRKSFQILPRQQKFAFDEVEK